MAAVAHLIDTHAHICDPVFDDDRSEVLDRAESAGIVAVIAVGENLTDAEKNLGLARQYRILYPAAGLYPTILDLAAADAMADFIRRHHTSLWAIGEVGLDFWIAKEEKERECQREIFALFIRLARELDLPLNVHSRSAGRHAIQVLLEHEAVRVQMHAFDGKISAARPALEAGFYFSIPPSIVRSRQKQKLVRHLPLTQLLVETDSPVLGAEPGERNEPAQLMTAVRAISRIKDVAEEEILDAVTKNALDLYRIRF